MKRIAKQICSLAAAVGILLAAGCDRTYVDEVVKQAPVIESFTPASAPVGTEIIVTGQHLSGVTKAYIGDQEMVIREKVSDTRLSIVAGANGRDGRIALVNTVGRGESEGSFTYTYAVPTLTASLLQKSVVMGDRLLLSGSSLTAVEAVIFTAEGYDTGYEGEIFEQSASEIVVRVPYVENSSVRITLRYFDGETSVSTPLDEAPSIEVVRVVPAFDQPIVLGRTAVGKSVTLTGRNLDKIDRILVGDFEATLSKQPNSLTFTVPAGNFEDGDTTTRLVAEYFDGHESIVLSDAFVVYVPYVKFWENITTVCQGRSVESSFTSFFSPENGRIYANEKWKSELDPVAMAYNGSQWSGTGNQPTPGVVSDEDYNSVVPYFFFSAVSGNVLQLNSPANSNSQLKNFFINATNPDGTSSNDNRVPGSNASIPGTPILGFRYLNAANADEKALIDKVLGGQIDNIDEKSFPLSTTDQTCCGIGLTSVTGGVKSSTWCDNQTSELKDTENYPVDAVFLVFYYANNGYSKEQPAANVKRIGLLHVRTINFRIYSASTPNYGNSTVTFDIYWQKYDYDYSKLNQ